MTGPEHYREAERLLAAAAALTPPISVYDHDALMRRAGVHGTLALAAATALGGFRVDDHGMPVGDNNEWYRVASVDGVDGGSR